MSWNGSGTFNRLYSWVADKAAGLDISSTRMDADTNDLASNGFGNCLTRDGQGGPTNNLPMNNFKHTGLANGSARTDSVAVAQVQDGLLNWTIAGGTADALTATYTPALTALNDGQICFVRAAAANATTAPTFSPNGLTARNIVKNSGNLLAAGDIAGVNHDLILRYNTGGLFWELLNPSNSAALAAAPTTGDVKMTIKTVADSGWLLLNDGTFGSATSGSSNSTSALNQALFVLMFNNLSDTAAPVFTSTGAATTRAGQGTAAAAWTANCRMSLPKTLGRAWAVAGDGGGLTSRALGSIVGEETHLLTAAEIASHTHANSLTDPGHAHTFGGTGVTSYRLYSAGTGGVTSIQFQNGTDGSVGINSNTTGITINNASAGGGGTHNNMQPSTFFSAMIKQ
ncbi:hypothetical protein IVB08_00225 [Bradyrhizobium sp. 173]|uniref:hypothetical protein n=1 Tax=Bradyrhizobium sp. 173 TaxID=2782644 RepID=UPI001FF96D85|nr:hypothetical protein [Bradyrhizobium sp. 173]MCK1562436.1 hypothetical protein [Bradyrhizobium sp. 173]